MLDVIDVAVVIWLALAALSGVGEMLSGTMFLLPIVAGAIVAAALAALGVDRMLNQMPESSPPNRMMADLESMKEHTARILDVLKHQTES